MWTPEQYKEWVRTRGPVDSWSHEDCKNADAIVKQTALFNFNRLLGSHDMPKAVRDFTSTMARCHYGSVEVDQLLVELKCYPEWEDG